MDAPLWKLLADAAEPGAEKLPAEAVRAAVEADPNAAARPFAAPDSTPRRLFRVTVAGLPNGERDESPPRVASAPPPSAALAHKLRAAVGVPSQGSVGAARRYYGNFAGASL